MESSDDKNIFVAWFLWHFYEMPGFLVSAWKNYLSFGSNYFSIPLLFSTLFSPWRKYKWFYPKTFDIKEFFNTLISNTFSRIIGGLCRIVLIIVGAVFQFFIFVLGSIIILLWLAIPFIIIAGVIFIL